MGQRYHRRPEYLRNDWYIKIYLKWGMLIEDTADYLTA
jgi:hypothetical protein